MNGGTFTGTRTGDVLEIPQRRRGLPAAISSGWAGTLLAAISTRGASRRMSVFVPRMCASAARITAVVLPAMGGWLVGGHRGPCRLLFLWRWTRSGSV